MVDKSSLFLVVEGQPWIQAKSDKVLDGISSIIYYPNRAKDAQLTNTNNSQWVYNAIGGIR
jgi:hypothetical protein